MIITCNNCNKKFEISSTLIPESGRLLQCNACNHKWFFKKEILSEPILVIKNNESVRTSDETGPADVQKQPSDGTEPADVQKQPSDGTEPADVQKQPVEIEYPETIELLDETVKDNPVIEKILFKDKTKNEEDKNTDKDINIKKSKIKKNFNILGLTIVFIISFVALIIVLDTFQKPISIIFPNIEFLLYNLYETINDIVLFFTDLIL